MTEKKDDSKRQIPTFDHDTIRKHDRGHDKGQGGSDPKNDSVVVSNTYRPPPPPVKKSDQD
jgi:hypothetical protein